MTTQSAGGAPAKRVKSVTSPTQITGNVARRVIPVTDGRAADGGAAEQVYYVATADLAENGGRFTVSGEEPIPVINVTSGAVRGGSVMPVYDVTGQEVPVIKGPQYIEFNGSSTLINCGANTSLANLASGKSITIDLWATTQELVATGFFYLIVKDDENIGDIWSLEFYKSIEANVPFALTSFFSTDQSSAFSDVEATWNTGGWHHYTVAYNDNGDRKVYLAVDGVWASTYLDQIAGTGAILDDSINSVAIGAQPNVGNPGYLDGNISWLRISNNIRWTPGINFTPPSRCNAPDVDGNTTELWKMDKGSGTIAAASVHSPANDGTITDGTWHDCK